MPSSFHCLNTMPPFTHGHTHLPSWTHLIHMHNTYTSPCAHAHAPPCTYANPLIWTHTKCTHTSLSINTLRIPTHPHPHALTHMYARRGKNESIDYPVILHRKLHSTGLCQGRAASASLLSFHVLIFTGCSCLPPIQCFCLPGLQGAAPFSLKYLLIAFLNVT